MYAIIEDSGGQLIVREGDVIQVDLRDLPADARTVSFDRVLVVSPEGGKDAKIGAPYVAGAAVSAEIIEREAMGEKIDVIRYKRRKNQKKKIGHRQRFMRVKVTSIKG